MLEEWKDIKDYKGKYQISNLGRIKSLRRKVVQSNSYEYVIKEKILKQSKNTNGYLSITLNNNGKKRFSVHRLVGTHFLNNPENKEQINHINGVKTDNRIGNLEWVTKSENQIHAYKSGLAFVKKKFSKKDAINIRLEYKKSKTTYNKLAKKYNTSRKTIFNIIKKREGY